jgi:aryl-alcohol dehydrogenase-like predicted oxidoreductase
VRTIELGRTGQQVSALALGAMQFGTATDEPTAHRMLDHFADLGGTHVDTANCYAWWNGPQFTGDESEVVLGRWFARTGRRDDVFLATKGSGRITDLDGVWETPVADWELARTRFEGTDAATLRTAIEGSLRRLGTDHVDLYHVHVDDPRTPLEETLETLHGFVVEGKVRYLGWSNVRAWRLERARATAVANGWTAPVAVQQQHTYLHRAAGARTASVVDDEQLDYLTANEDVTLLAYSPTIGGTYDDDAKFDRHHQRALFDAPVNDVRRARVQRLARELGCSANQLVLAWLLAQHRPQVSPITGVRTWEQYVHNVAAAEITLPAEVLAELDDPE